MQALENTKKLVGISHIKSSAVITKKVDWVLVLSIIFILQYHPKFNFGSRVVTGKFPTNLTISGNETKNIIVTLSLSINKSFEWTEVINDGKYEPSQGENIVDMGLRGLVPTFSN